MAPPLTTTDLSFVQPPPLTYAGCATRQRKLFCLFVCRGTLTYYSVGTISLRIPYSMHLMVPTHPYFFWAVCHHSRTFPPKEPEQESHNRFSPLPTTRPCCLTSNPWPTTSCIGWVQASGVWALRVLHFYVCLKPAYCSCVRHGQEARLHVLSSILDFLWRELFSYFPSFHGLLPLGLDFVWLWAFLHSAHSFALFCSLTFRVVPFCYSCCDVIWPKPARPL